MKPIKEQIQQTLDDYTRTATMAFIEETPVKPHLVPPIKFSLRLATLSGMALAAHFLAANDGDPNITPNAVESACIEIARELGMSVETLRKEQPDVSGNTGQ